MTKRTTRTAINKALAEAGFEPGTEIVHGNGYWYFSGGDTSGWYSTAVYTYHLSDLSVNDWVSEAKSKRGERPVVDRCVTSLRIKL
jgi:hypothetical protein